VTQDSIYNKKIVKYRVGDFVIVRGETIIKPEHKYLGQIISNIYIKKTLEVLYRCQIIKELTENRMGGQMIFISEADIIKKTSSAEVLLEFVL